MFGIKVQHYSCDFAPVSTLCVRVEQAQIRDDVLLAVLEIEGRPIAILGEYHSRPKARRIFYPFGRRPCRNRGDCGSGHSHARD